MHLLISPSPPRLITLLRRPIDLAMSMFSHCNKYTEDRYNESWFDFGGWLSTSVAHLKRMQHVVGAEGAPLTAADGKLLKGHRTLINFCPYPAHNPQAARLVLNSPQQAFTTRWTPEWVNKAVRAVEGAYHVGVTEHYGASLCLLSAKLGRPRVNKLQNCQCISHQENAKEVGTKAKLTQTHSHEKLAQVSSSTLKHISFLMALDEALYSHAVVRLFRELNAFNLTCLLKLAKWRNIHVQ